MSFTSIFHSPKRASVDISLNKRWSASTASLESPTSRVRHRFSSILHGRKASITTLETLDSEPRYSSSSDRSSLQQPPTPPPHTYDTVFEEPEPFDLARQVRVVLGTALDEVDEEIELEWEDCRKKMRQSLQLPKRPITVV